MFNQRPNCRLTIILLACCVLAGCGGKGLETLVIHGTVTLGGEKAEMGRIRFVPIGGTPGPASRGDIRAGEYRIESRGGVPLGRHRVEIAVFRETGESSGFDDLLRTEQLGLPKYRTDASPLTVEITEDSDGVFDFNVPRGE